VKRDRTDSLPHEYHQKFCETANENRKNCLENPYPTFRIQDYSWDERGYSELNRFYGDISEKLDNKFKTICKLTYGTMGSHTGLDTSMFRTATWNYIQCLVGIRHDDYDYAEVNDLLHRSLKKYIKTASCYPEQCNKDDYEMIMRDFKESEKIHVMLLVSEAKFQSELLYALKAISSYFTKSYQNTRR
jgi:sestrin